jgi:hypothetical protein
MAGRGCARAITLEFMIWLLYGNDELNNFYGQLKGDAQNHSQDLETVTKSFWNEGQLWHFR